MSRRAMARLAGPWLALLLAACVTPSPTLSPSASPTATPEPTATATVTAAPTATGEPTPSATTEPTPEPTLALDLPEEADDRVVDVSVEPTVGADGGTIFVIVTSRATERIDELVLRWPRELNRTLFLRPFEPSEARIADGGPPLVQEWTKWVLGPGEEGEPAGTISLGWGPLLAGATLQIEIDVVRRADGPVEFDFQVLAENSLLTLSNGEPAELRVEIP